MGKVREITNIEIKIIIYNGIPGWCMVNNPLLPLPFSYIHNKHALRG